MAAEKHSFCMTGKKSSKAVADPSGALAHQDSADLGHPVPATREDAW